MDKIYDLLDELEDLLDSCKNVPFSNRVSVNKEEVFEIISEIRMNIPNEVKQAQRIDDNCDKIINDANNKAKDIIRQAEEKCEKLISDHEITKSAREEAVSISEEAKATAREMRLAAVEYTDNILAKTEQAMRETLDEFLKQTRITEDYIEREINIIYNNRQELRGN